MSTLNFIYSAFVFIVVGLLFEGGSTETHASIVFEFIFLIILVVIIYFIKRKERNKFQEKLAEKKQIEQLAQKYIEDNIVSCEDDLLFDDYKKFNNIVQFEHHISVKNDNITEVPYCIRESLYNEYLKKIRKLKKNS